MDKIYAPWRDSYVAQVTGDKNKFTDDKCVFCEIFKQKNDEQNFVLRRTADTVTVLNLYPYNAGHLMVLPLDHKAQLSDLPLDVRSLIMEETNLAVEIIKVVFKPEAFNIGINMGKVSGGGIPTHMHVHIVPRWNGDANFIAVIFDDRFFHVSSSTINVNSSLS